MKTNKHHYYDIDIVQLQSKILSVLSQYLFMAFLFLKLCPNLQYLLSILVLQPLTGHCLQFSLLDLNHSEAI